MKLNTFYNIYYRHRIVKAKFILKIYIFLSLPFSYLINLIYIPKIINFDQINKDKFTEFNLDMLLEYFGSDKAKRVFNQYPKPAQRNKEKIVGHGYSEFYEKYFQKYIDVKCTILELGAFNGNALAAFYFYLKNSLIFSGDIFPDILRYKSERIKNFYIDSGSESSLKKNIVNSEIRYDIIIDDASHILKDQIITLFMCFKKLNSKGIFVIEELNFPDTREDMRLNFSKPTLRTILYDIKNKKNFSSKYIKEEDKNYFLKNFQSIEIYMGQKGNDIAFITKK